MGEHDEKDRRPQSLALAHHNSAFVALFGVIVRLRRKEALFKQTKERKGLGDFGSVYGFFCCLSWFFGSVE